MKFIVVLALTLSTSAFARQYIQCSENSGSTVMVVNLQDAGKQSTLFISSGMQNPEDERLIVNIEFDKIEGKESLFKVVGEDGEGSVFIPTTSIGKSSDFVSVKLHFASNYYEFSCFSRIYND